MALRKKELHNNKKSNSVAAKYYDFYFVFVILFAILPLKFQIFELHMRYSALQYSDVVQALKRGDLRLLRRALQEHEDQYLPEHYPLLFFFFSVLLVLEKAHLDCLTEDGPLYHQVLEIRCLSCPREAGAPSLSETGKEDVSVCINPIIRCILQKNYSCTFLGGLADISSRNRRTLVRHTRSSWK